MALYRFLLYVALGTETEVSSLAASWSGARTGLSLIEPDPGLVLVY